MSDQLPAGWVLARLGDVCELVSQRGPSADRETFRYIDLGAIDNKAKRVAEAGVVPTRAAPSRAKQVVKAGDVVFSTVRVYLENIAEVPDVLDGAIASTAFCVLRPASGISSRYLYHYVTSRPFVLAVNQLQRGNSPPSVQDGDIRSQPLPLAPRNEQQRVASKVDELFSLIEEGERALERVQKMVDCYRQSVLKAAVTGELTRDWREKNKGKLESGEALLARILKARREAWEKAELDKMKAKGITPSNDKWKQKYEEPTPPDTAELPELPDGWAWVTLGHLTRELDQGWSPQCESTPASPDGTDWGVIKTTAIQAMRYEGEANKALPPTFEPRHRLEVRPGDILVTRAGPRTRVGICCLVRATRSRLMICDKVYRLRLFDRLVSNDYVEIALNSPLLLRELEKLKSGISDSGLNLTQERFLALTVPLPPVAEQQRIADAVAEAFSDVETSAHYADLSGNALRQAILKIAFCGRLVAQSPEDEPADQLLARLTAEHAAGLVSQHRRKGRRAA